LREEYVEDVLNELFSDMIDWYQNNTYENAQYDLYYELVDEHTLNILVTETWDGQLINETKFVYQVDFT
jgi:hypothetical protein